MVYLSARFFFSAIYLSTHFSYLMAWDLGPCCAGDKTCSGCWMCPGSNLRKCWDSATQEVDACPTTGDLTEQVNCLCAAYAKIAYCWSKGKCCTEYAPTLHAATNVCNLQTYPKEALNQGMVDQAVRDAYKVRDTIWHNDSGQNVPILSVYVKVYSASGSTSYSTESSDSGTSSKDGHYSKASTKYHSHAQVKIKATSETLEADKDSSEAEANSSMHKTTSHEAQPQTKTSPHSKPDSNTSYSKHDSHDSYSKHDSHDSYSKHDSHDSYSKPESTHPFGIVHQHAKCSRQTHKCQSQIASQYHKARRDSSDHDHVKRDLSPLTPNFFLLPKRAEKWKRSEGAQGECGTDFHGVKYPQSVPSTVSKIFAAM